MLPSSPISVKIHDEDRAKIKALCSLMGWSENRIIRDCVAHTMHLLFDAPNSPSPTNLLPLGKHVLDYDQKNKIVPIGLERDKGHGQVPSRLPN